MQFRGVVVLRGLGLPSIFHLKYDLHAFKALLVVNVSDAFIVFPLLHMLQRDDVETAI